MSENNALASHAAEKGLLSNEMPEKHTSGPKGPIDFVGFMPGINPRPTARRSFPAACSANRFCTENSAFNAKSGADRPRVQCFHYHGRSPLAGLEVDSLAEVRVQEGEPLENALRRFKRKVQQEDIIKEVKRHSYYLKPGEKKRVKAALARKRNRKKARKEQD